jgi:hypothetical protein
MIGNPQNKKNKKLCVHYSHFCRKIYNNTFIYLQFIYFLLTAYHYVIATLSYSALKKITCTG